MSDSPPVASASLWEATSLLFIVACLVVIVSYLVMNNHVPILDTVLTGVMAILYEFFPVLSKFKALQLASCSQGAWRMAKHWVVNTALKQVSQAPEIVTSLAAGLFTFIVGIPLTPQIARLCGPKLGDMEAQMKGRQRNPQKVRIK
jgi:hypothetical protein